MFNFFEKDNNSEVKMKVSNELVNGEIKTATMKLIDYIEAVTNKKIVPYENNRGGLLNWSKIHRIANKYDSMKLGIITLSDWGDGTYKNTDAHHRTEAIIQKFNSENTFTNEELEQNLSLHLVQKENFLRVYTGLNANNGHSTRHSLNNPDQGLGGLIKEILNHQKIESCVEEKFYSMIARSIYGYVGEIKDKPIKDLTFADITLDRKKVASDANLSKDDFDLNLTTNQKKEIVNAIDYVNETMIAFQKLNNLSNRPGVLKLSETTKSLVRSAQLFGFLLWDKLSGREEITVLKPKSLAMKLSEKNAAIDYNSKFLMNSELRDQSAQKIIDLIRTKKRK